MYVYADLLIGLNWVMNIAILLGTSKIAGIPSRPVRIFLSAGIGAFVPVAMLLPAGAFLRWPWVKILISLIMAVIAFYPLPLRRWPIIMSVFYLTSFVLAGLVLGMLYFADASANLIYGIFTMRHTSWITFISAAVLLCYVGRWTWGKLAKRLWQPKYVMPIQIYLSGNDVRISALMDSGNCLQDPISHLPVVIAEYSVLKPILPAEICVLLDKTGEESWLDVLQYFPSDWTSRLHIVPYSSLGRKSGIIIGFRPDYLVVEQKENTVKCTAVIIGICKRRLAGHGEYNALLHPELVHGEIECDKEAS